MWVPRNRQFFPQSMEKQGFLILFKSIHFGRFKFVPSITESVYRELHFFLGTYRLHTSHPAWFILESPHAVVFILDIGWWTNHFEKQWKN